MERPKELNDELFPPMFDSFTSSIAFNADPQPPCHFVTCDDTADAYNNLSTPTTADHHPPRTGSYDAWQTASFGALAAVISVVTVVGNITVIVSFILERSIRQTTNYFIASLAVTDLLIGCISMPLYTVYLLSDQTWLFGETLCDLWLALDYTLCLCSIYTVFCITIDRYCSVTIPASYRKWRTERKVLAVVAVTWVFPVLVFFPSIIGWQYVVKEGRTVARDQCYVQYMESALFNCLLQVGYFWATLVVMCALYAGIYRVALRLHRRTEHRRRRTVSLMSVAGETLTNIGIGMTGAVGGRRVKVTVPMLPAAVKGRPRIAAAVVGRSGSNGVGEKPSRRADELDTEDEEEEEEDSGSFADSPKTFETFDSRSEDRRTASDDGAGGSSCQRSTTATATSSSSHRERPSKMAAERNVSPVQEVLRKKYSLLTPTMADDVFVATEAKQGDGVASPATLILPESGQRWRLLLRRRRRRHEITPAAAADGDDDDFPVISEEERRRGSVEQEETRMSLNHRRGARPLLAATTSCGESEMQRKSLAAAAAADAVDGDRSITPTAAAAAASVGRRRQISRRSGPRFRWRLSTSSTNDSPDLWPRPPKKGAQQVTGVEERGRGGEGGGRRKNEGDSLNLGCACVSRVKSDSSCEKEDYSDAVFYCDGSGSSPGADRSTANDSKPRLSFRTEKPPPRKTAIVTKSIGPDDDNTTTTTIDQQASSDRPGSAAAAASVTSAVVCAIRRFARSASSQPSESPATPFGGLPRGRTPLGSRSANRGRLFRLPVTLRQFSSGKQQVVRTRPARGISAASSSSSSSSSSRQKTENHAKKSVRTITLILGAFVVCWTPWHVLSLIIGFCDPKLECVPPLLYNISYWLCYLNSPLNPFCYAFANQHFKKTFVRILKFDWRRN